MIHQHRHRAARRAALSVALGLCLASGAAFAQSNTAGSIYGRASSGDVIVVENTNNGSSREVTVGADGAYRVSALPTGVYKITRRRADGTTEVRENVQVSVGTGAPVSFAASGETELDAIEVRAASASPIDMSSVESATILTEALIDRIPVPRTVTDVALLAPGTTQGDSAFGNLASFGGATVGENAYYINGFNVTNFRNGLGGSTVPFEFYEEFQVKTGGYGAEFGRSTGGVINAITKRGGNEWKAGVNAYWNPGSLVETTPCTFDAEGNIVSRGCESDFDDSIEANAYVSGPIVKDRLFFMAMYNVRDFSQNGIIGGEQANTINDDPFWGAKLDWYVTDNHLLEYTGFSDERKVVEVSPDGNATSFRGGRNDIFKYTGYLTESFTLSALYGQGDYSRTDAGDGDACPAIIDLRTSTRFDLGCWTNLLPGIAEDSREATRVDAEWDLGNVFLGSHLIRFGWDREVTSSRDLSNYSGGVYYLYQTVGGAQRARQRFYFNGGTFETESTALYIEDSWKISENVLLSIGLRNETFDNRNANGESFIEVDDQLAPRLGLSWDISGDGSQKFFANYGRYYLPIASNTNIRLAGSELFTEQFFQLLGVNADGTPQLGNALGPVTVFADGSIKDPRSIVDQDIEPMYQDEFILGFQHQFSENWSGGVRFVRRELKSTIEDVAIDAALNAYAAANGFAGFSAGGFDYYVLTNPGTDMRVGIDLDGDGTLEDIQLSAEQLGYPESKRSYNALELFFERSWDGVWFLQGSYTWSQSYGNNEGYVRSDNGQDDAGLTTLFDQPGLLDGADGYLPNDRRHQIKLFGAWQFADGLTASANASWRTGRPINCFGNHPTDEFAAAYGSESFYCDGQLVPRGSRGRTEDIFQLDLGLAWEPSFLEGARVNLDVVNILNQSGVTEVNEVGEFDGAVGDLTPTYGIPAAYQQPRYVRMSFSYDW